MEIQSSYIFLRRQKEIKATLDKSGENSMRLKFLPNFNELFKQTFDKVFFHEENRKLGFIVSGTFSVLFQDEEKEVLFKYYSCGKNYYLNIILDEKKRSDVVDILNIVSNKLIGKGNIFDKYYVSIVSYDYSSEYYCNRLFPYLNKFERKLKKLLFNVYTLNFNMDYYFATTAEFKNVIEKNSNINKPSGISKKDVAVKLGFYSLTYKDMEKLLFTESILPSERKKLQDFLKNNDDLSKLSDLEIRNAFGLCTYKTDWERFFGNKGIDENFKSVLDKIRLFRNSIAHCKFINAAQYEECLMFLKTTSKSLDKAIKITETQDFMTKNVEIARDACLHISKMISEILNNVQIQIKCNLQNLKEELADIIDSTDENVPENIEYCSNDINYKE